MNPKKLMRVSGWVLVALCAGIVVQQVLRLPYRLQFSWPWLNYWTFAMAAFFFPILLGLQASTLSVKWLRYLVMVFAWIVMIPSFFLASCAAINMPEGPDLSYERISETADGSIAYRLYRTNCGATCSFGLSLREERDLGMGLIIVSYLWGADRMSQGQVVLKESQVLVVDGDKVLAELPR